MQAYYGLSRKGNVIVYIPYHFAGISMDGMKFRFRFDIDFLERLNKFLSERKFKSLANNQINQTEVGDNFLKAFREILYSSTRNKIEEEAQGLVEMILKFDHDGSFCKSRESYPFQIPYKEDYPYDEEDYQDDWWLRGEEPFGKPM